jgi:hypothetical protein
VGVDIIPLADARRLLLAALRRGESVGLVADRDLSGGGIPVPLFGHPAPIPGGPALLALEADVPVWVAAARRAAGGRYRCRMILVPAPGRVAPRAPGGPDRRHRGRLRVDPRGRPEQWWGAFTRSGPTWRRSRTGTRRCR